ncbi:MAG: metallophosphoesterase [Bacteroidales bacterium]|jgi:3',5'-cyclic AMP phosphodiesterase CpdA
MKRRNFLKTTALTGAAISTFPNYSKATTLTGKREHSLRIVQVTDMHIFPSEKVKAAISNLLEEIHDLQSKPDFVLNTGDAIMDSLSRSKKETIEQWEAYKNYFLDPLQYKIYCCIGNHDVWGWKLHETALEQDPDYGKNMAMKYLELDQRYYSFNAGDWHIICLDSTFKPEGEFDYIARLDDEQFSWLENDLQNTPENTPVLIVSHIPVLSASVFFDGDNEKNGNWQVPGQWMHIDARRIKDLLFRHPNVKAAVCGHVHLVDAVNYLGLSYFTNGAVSGAWWKGAYQEFSPAYAIIDLYADGSVDCELREYNLTNARK